MELRKLGASDLMISPVIFGSWAIGGWLWGGADDEQSIRAIRAAIDEGMTTIDTAPVYGMGHSERIVGEAIKGRRDQIVIATKVGPRWDRGGKGVFSQKTVTPDGKEVEIWRTLEPDSILEECDRSLRRLGVDVIDLYQCHWPDPSVPAADAMGALMSLKEQGKIRNIGVSNFPADMIADFRQYGPIVSDQPRFNLMKRDILKDVLPYCRANGIGVVAYSPMEHGILSGAARADRVYPPTDLRSKHPWYQPGNRERVNAALETIRPIAETYGVTLAQLSVNWVIGEPGVTAALVGARNPEQVRENAKAASFRLTAEERAFMLRTFEILGEPVQASQGG